MKITLVPYAGLCNRLNAIVSGLAYKEKYPDTELTILWHKWFHCNCRFKDLFQQIPPPYTPVKELVMQFKDFPAHKLNLGIPQRIRGLWYDCSILPSSSSDHFEELTKGKNRVYVCHDNRFCEENTVLPFSHSLAQFFRPTNELQKRIDEVTNGWEKHYVIGLHIRRTDNTRAIEGSPMEYFYHIIEREIMQHKDAKFYVATDDEGVKRDLFSRYGEEKIITIPLHLNRNSKQGMKDAVVDLYCLGRTRKIYGSKCSTYSTFAAHLYDVEVFL